MDDMSAYGVVVRPANERDVDGVLSDLREGDASEQAVFGGPERAKDCWRTYSPLLAVDIHGETAAVMGATTFSGEDESSERRYLSMLTTGTVDRHPTDFVRSTREGLSVLLSLLPKHVRRVYTLTRADYDKAVRWLDRTVGMVRYGEVTIRGIRHIIYERTI